MVLKSFLFGILGFAFLLVTPAFAAGPNVGVSVSSFDTRDNDTVAIPFVIENPSSQAIDMLYRLEIVAKDPAAFRGATDTTPYVAVHVGPRASLTEHVTYSAPDYVDGEYELHLTVKSAAGFPLTGTLAGTAMFNGTPSPVVLLSCTTPVGERGRTMLMPEQRPKFACDLKNTTESAQTVKLQGRLSLWGQSPEVGATTEVTIAPNKTTEAELTFPQLGEAGRYEGDISVDQSGSRISPRVRIDAVRLGTSAHITKTEFDKDIYAAGEIAVATVFVLTTPPLDASRPDALTLTTSLQDGAGVDCTQSQVITLASGIEKVALPVERRCSDPQVVATVQTTDGSLLDQATLSTSGLASVESDEASAGASIALLIGSVFLAVLAVYLVLRQRRQPRSRRPTLGLIFLIALGTGISVQPALASTLSGSVGLGTDNFSVTGIGNGINFYTGNSSAYVGTIALSGSMQISGAVGMPTDNFTIVGNGSQLDFYTGNASNYAGSLYVTGGTLGGSASCNTDAWAAGGSGSQFWVICGSGPGGSIGFVDTPICVPSVGAACTSPANICGMTAAGTITCPGSCSAPMPNNGLCPGVPSVDLKVNGSDGPLSLTLGSAKNFTWTVSTDATSCAASSSDGWTGNKTIPSGSETLSATFSSNHTLTCVGPGGTSSDSVQINVACAPVNGAFGLCNCASETKSRTNINAACLPWNETVACSGVEKDHCRNINWREVGQ